MKIAIVGSGRMGLSAAHVLGEDPRHLITVFETRARFGATSVDHLARLGVVLHRSAQVERLAVVRHRCLLVGPRASGAVRCRSGRDVGDGRAGAARPFRHGGTRRIGEGGRAGLLR